MKVSLRKCLLVQVACLGLWPILLFAQSPDLAQNLADCRNGRETCDPSKLSPSQSADVALAGHGRNVSNCRNGYDSCDHSKLTQQETIALALADPQENLSACKNCTECAAFGNKRVSFPIYRLLGKGLNYYDIAWK